MRGVPGGSSPLGQYRPPWVNRASRLTAPDAHPLLRFFMRRLLAITVIPLLACLVIAGCGSSKPSASSSSSAAANNSSANASVTVAGAFGTTPVVKIPKLHANNKLTVKTVIPGTGSTVTKSDAMAANFVLYFWSGKSSTLKANTFGQNPTVIGG